MTREGLAEALAGVETVIDAASHPTPEQGPATEFFLASSWNFHQLGKQVGVRRLIVVSIIGIDRFGAGFLAARKVHEQAVLEGPIPVRILRAAQFHEFVEPLLAWTRQENGVRGRMPPWPARPTRNGSRARDRTERDPTSRSAHTGAS